jgi:pilus assembly protein CpaE
MAGTHHQPMRLIIIDSDRNARSCVKHYLEARGVRIIGEAGDLKAGERLVQELHPDAVIVELPDDAADTVDFVKRTREELLSIGVIIARYQPSPQVILACMGAGAHEFVGRPLDELDVERAVAHAGRLMENSGGNGKTGGAMFSIFSSKGGVGATSIAANLAVALARQSGGTTVLVDMSFQFGDLGLMFNQPPKYSLTDALEKGSLDQSKLRSIICEHESGVSLVTVATSPDVAQEITRQHIVELFEALNTIFDYVVVDIGRFLDDRTVEVLESSDAILLISTLDVPSIRNVNKYLDMFSRLELDSKKIHLVLNRHNKKSLLSLRDMEKALKRSVFWIIPNDFEPMSLGIDEGTPAILEASRSKLAHSFKLLAEACTEMFTEPPSEAMRSNAG